MITLEHFKSNILPITLKHEGGYVNDPADKGGETYRGISKRANPTWQGWQHLEKHKPLNRGDIVNDRELCKAVAELYWQKYFEANKFNELNSLRVALQLFDFAVHGGYSVKGLQKMLNEKFNQSLLVDGVIGSKTISALNSCLPTALAIAIIDWRKSYLDNIILRDETQRKFERGWNNRLSYMRAVKEI